MAAPLPNGKNLKRDMELEKASEITEQIKSCRNIPTGCEEIEFRSGLNSFSLKREEKIQLRLQAKPDPILTFRIVKFMIFNGSNPRLTKDIPAMVLMETNTAKSVAKRMILIAGIANVDSLFELNKTFLLSVNNNCREYIGNMFPNILFATIRKIPPPIGGKRTKKRKYRKKKHSKSYKNKKVL